MDDILLMNIFFALLISNIYMASYIKRAIRMVESAFRTISPNEFIEQKKELEIIRAHISATTWFIIISGIVITIGFVTLYIFQYYAIFYPPYIAIFVSSGIYIPIFLLIMGYTIKHTFKVYTSKSSNTILSSTEMKTITIFMAVILNIILIVLDWKLGVFAAAIILGKYIWIDSVFDENTLKDQTAVIKSFLKSDGNMRVEVICIIYAKNFYPAFIAPTIIYQFIFKKLLNIAVNVSDMVPIYISMIGLYESFIIGMDMKQYLAKKH